MIERLVRSPVGLVSLAFLLGLCLLAAFAPWLAPNDPMELSLADRFAGRSAKYPLGADHLGRCVLSRLLWGARPSLGAAALVGALTAVLGFVIGATAGYARGRIDEALMRTVDFVLAFPTLLFAFAIVGFLGPGLDNAVIAIVAVHWAHHARTVRALTLTVGMQEYISAARLLALRSIAVLLRHMLPNVAPVVVVVTTLDAGWILLQLSAFSFLGLGVQAPTPEWGMMVFEARTHFRTNPTLMIYPGTAIFATVVALNLLGDALSGASEEVAQSQA